MGKQVRFMTFGDVLRDSTPPPEMILPPLIAKGTLGMIYAPPGAGKTYFTLWLAAAIAGGGRFLKWLATSVFKILYIDAEMCTPGFKPRLEELARSLGFELDESSALYTAPDLYPDGCFPYVSDPAAQAEYTNLIISQNIDVIFIDNYCSATNPNGRDTDEQVWGRVKPWILRLRSLGKAVIIVHHAGKSGQQLGTSLKEQPLNWLITMHPFKVGDPNLTQFWVRFQKHIRSSAPSDSQDFYVSFWMEDGEVKWLWCDAREKRQALISEYRGLGMRDQNIQDLLGISSGELFLLEKKTWVPQSTNWPG